MTRSPTWWKRPRTVSVVVDNPSWIRPVAEELVKCLNEEGDAAVFCGSHDKVGVGGVAFYLGCTTITPVEVLRRSRRNLVVHESDLPDGRGFSPLTWQILEGKNEVPICLLEAEAQVDSGNIVYRETLGFSGHELIEEIRAVQGKATIDLCLRFMRESFPPEGISQNGSATHYRRRTPEDSRLDAERTIRDQFRLLRTVDNEKYPAFFELNGYRYKIAIEKLGETPEEGKK